MLNGKLIALAAAVAILGMGVQASAYSMDVQGTVGGGATSTTVILNYTWTLGAGEGPYDTSDMNIGCTGCIITGYSWNQFAPGLVQWYGQQYGAPNGYGNTGTELTNLGGFIASPNTWTGTGATWTAGFVTIHISQASGSVTPLVNVGNNGIGLLGVPDTNVVWSGVSWVPEPGTGLMLALGLGGLGLMGRRNR